MAEAMTGWQTDLAMGWLCLFLTSPSQLRAALLQPVQPVRHACLSVSAHAMMKRG